MNPSVDNVESLKNAINDVPLVRADKVEQAKALVANPTYPSDATLSKVANLLAANIE